MLHSVINSLFGCSHNRTTFPITRGRKSLSVAAAATSNAGNRTYVVCLDCGKEFAYDWQQMRVRHARKQHVYASVHLEAKAS